MAILVSLYNKIWHIPLFSNSELTYLYRAKSQKEFKSLYENLITSIILFNLSHIIKSYNNYSEKETKIGMYLILKNTERKVWCQSKLQ